MDIIYLKAILTYLAIGSDTMKKIVLLVLMVIFLTACDVKYNIEFKDDKVYENFTVSVNKNTEKISSKYLKENDFYVSIDPEMVKYNKKIEERKDIEKFLYSYSYDIDNYINSKALSSCFKAYTVIKENDYYMFTTSKGVKCIKSDTSTIIDNLDIVITSNHKLIETNADEVSGYKYIWHVNDKNYKNKFIKLKLYQKKYVFNYRGSFVKKLLLSLAILTIAIIVVIKVRSKIKNSNNL